MLNQLKALYQDMLWEVLSAYHDSLLGPVNGYTPDYDQGRIAAAVTQLGHLCFFTGINEDVSDELTRRLMAYLKLAIESVQEEALDKQQARNAGCARFNRMWETIQERLPAESREDIQNILDQLS